MAKKGFLIRWRVYDGKTQVGTSFFNKKKAYNFANQYALMYKKDVSSLDIVKEYTS